MERPLPLRKLSGHAWEKLRRQVFDRDKGLCQPCLKKKGRITAGREVDHIMPVHQGGTDDLANLQTICTDCHTDKTLRERGVEKPRIGLDGWPLGDRG